MCYNMDMKKSIARSFRLAVFTASLASAVHAAEKPNVIFVLTDDLGYGDVGWAWQLGRPANVARIQTPNLDRLAAEGVILTDHYCAAPVCAPSRASILTGVKQDRCSVHDNMFDHPITEPETLGTVMKRGGYRTMAIGKWGVGGGGQSGKPLVAHPLDKGFDSYYGFMDHMAGHTYYHYDGYFGKAYMGLWNGREKVTQEGTGIYSTDLFVARAKKDITDAVKDHPDQPFFLYFAVNTVHGSGRCDDTLRNKHSLHVPGRPYPAAGVTWPLEPEPLDARNTWIDPRYRDLTAESLHRNKGSAAPSPDRVENMRRYATAISRLDDAMADLMRHLEALGVADNTIVIFTSDNGPTDEYGTDTRLFQSTGPFDGMKRDVYEGGLRVPTFVWKKGGFVKGKVDRMPSISWDWMPTLAQIAGVPVPAQCDGVSLWSRWNPLGAEPAPSRIETAYKGPAGWEQDYREFAARKEGLVRGEQRMRREGDIVTLQAGGPDKPWRRYNVVADPHQDHPLEQPENF